MCSTATTLTKLPNEMIHQIVVSHFLALLDAPHPNYTSHIMAKTWHLAPTRTLWDTWTLSSDPLYINATALARTSKQMADHVLEALEVLARTSSIKLDTVTLPLTEANALTAKLIDSLGDNATAHPSTSVETYRALPAALIPMHALRGTLAAVRNLVAALELPEEGEDELEFSKKVTDGLGSRFVVKIQLISSVKRIRAWVHGPGAGNEIVEFVVEGEIRGKNSAKWCRISHSNFVE